MNIILQPNRTVKYVFAALTFPLIYVFAFIYVSDIFATLVFSVSVVLPTAIVAFIFWLIDRKKGTRLRFYTNYLLLSSFAMSIVIAVVSRVFYEPYRIDCLKREELLGIYFKNYREKFGQYPKSLDEPFFDNAPKGSIIPFFGRYQYLRYDPMDIPPPSVPIPPPPTMENDFTAVAEAAPEPVTKNLVGLEDLRGLKKESLKKEIKAEVSISIRYTSLFGRDRCFWDCDDFKRKHGEFLSGDIEEF
jgi:uncharacterized membrane protein